MTSKAENCNSDGEQVIRDISQILPPSHKKKSTKPIQGEHVTKSSDKIIPGPPTSSEKPRKRGRPRKQVTQTKVDDDVKPEINKGEIKEGEKLDEAVEIEQGITGRMATVLGMEKKTSLEQNTESTDKSDHMVSSKVVVKKKRGRPRKTKVKESTTNKRDDEPKKKRKRKNMEDDVYEDNEYAYPNSGYTTKSGRVVNKKKTDDESTCTASTQSDTDHEDGRNFHDYSTLDEKYKALYDKYKEEADVWVGHLNNGKSAKCRWCSMNYKKLTTILRHYDKCHEYYKNGFNCNECGNIFKSPGSLNYHKLANHTKAVVEESQKKDKKQSEAQVLKQLLRQKKKLNCKNESCTKSFTTVLGYQYHMKRCGVEEVAAIYTCQICQKTYTTDPGLKYHLSSRHAPTVEKASLDKTEEVFTDDSGKRRRSAAHRAMASMKELKEKGYVEVNDTGKEEKRTKTSTNDFMLFTSPNIEIDEDLLKEWKAQFSLKQRVPCPFDCDFTAVLLVSLKDHYHFCQENPNAANNSERYKCNICNKEYTIRASIISHVRGTHTKDERDKYFIEHNIPIMESESDSDEEDEDEGIDENDYNEGGRFVDYEVAKHRNHSYFIPGQCIKQYYKWKKENHCSQDERLFSESSAQLNNWKLLSESDAAKAEPKCMMSPRFKVKVDDESVDIEDKQDEEEEYIRLERYGVTTHATDKNVNLFVGGPVWAMAWCPTPVSSHSANQYAAISCHQTFDSVHKCCTRYVYPGAIQIWRFGCLLDNGNYEKPYLSYGLAHNCGAIWDLKWCPSGCWDDPADTQPGTVSRLGVFAVACSNSTVCVFSVPHEEALSDARNDGKPGFYDVTPTLTLKPASSASDWSMIGQCWCLDWLPCQPHNQIAAGFSNGLIAIWNLTTSSPLLKEDSKHGTSLYPIQTFLAHGNQVSGLSWCPTDPNFFASVGYDHKILFWNLKNVAQPLFVREKHQPLACRWTIHTKGIVVSHDTMTGGSSVYYQDYGAFSCKPQTIVKKETCMPALDNTNWLDSIVAGDVLGDVRCQAVNMGKRLNSNVQYTFV
ncbi:uncharacterized protein LOC117104116 isoform X2 [Anneissia japonica]|uniref:uncharacterized protein LOC117104116 isoform X2 n=1 Tax=Anneissia japonica TaxID=1529436 RepID=UPI001425B582|nr:uncharacterized protein LOC117104116 isoform X2 [Anneissia japonica]